MLCAASKPALRWLKGYRIHDTVSLVCSVTPLLFCMQGVRKKLDHRHMFLNS